MNRGFLTGAGFTYDLGMPLVGELTDVFLGMFTKNIAERLAAALSKKDPFGEGRPISPTAVHEAFRMIIDYQARKGRNYEELLKEIELAAGPQNNRTQPERDSFYFVFAFLYDIIHRILVAYQHVSYQTLYQEHSQWFRGLKGLLGSKGNWIFSLNHDLYIECLAIDLGIPITYGDTADIEFPVSNVEFHNKINLKYRLRSDFDRLDHGWIQGSMGINLVRLHGGLAEQMYRDKALICNPNLSCSHSAELMREFGRIDSMAYYHNTNRVYGGGGDRTITGPDGRLDIISRSMLTGGKKYSTTTNDKKGEEKLKLFSEIVRSLDELVIMGYGFGDSHINDRILNAMVLNATLKLCIIDPVRRPWPPFLAQFDYGFRLRGATAGAAPWMTYATDGKWDSTQTEALQRTQSLRAAIVRQVKLRFSQEAPA